MMLKKYVLLTTMIMMAPTLISCGSSNKVEPIEPMDIKVVAFNDFHGNIEVPVATNGGSVMVKDPNNAAGTKLLTGGGAYLATMIKNLKATNPNTIVVGAGDMVSASPVVSTLTHEEAAVETLNKIGLDITAVGNHEFDHGKAELLRIQNGGCYPNGTIGTDTCVINNTFSGAAYKYLSANVVDSATGQTLFPATYIKTFGKVKIGFVGLTLKGTPDVVTSTGVAGLTFLDEVTTINRYAADLKAQGVASVVVLIHQGGQSTATTLNDQSCPGFNGEIVPIVKALSNDVDVVVSGHTHQEYVCNLNGKLVTSTGFYGSTVTDLNLNVSRDESGAYHKTWTANNLPVVNDTNKDTATLSRLGYTALTKDAATDSVIQTFVGKVAAVKSLTVGTITADIKRALIPNVSTPTRDETAEGAMGDVMADAYLAGGPQADFAMINPGGVRADLLYNASTAGKVTYGDLVTVAPFGNTLVAVDLTGAQVSRLLEQHWEQPNCVAKTGANGCGRLLQPSVNLSYTVDLKQASGAAVGSGNRIVAGSIKLNGAVLDSSKKYRVVVNSFMGPGPGDNFDVITNAIKAGLYSQNSGVVDIDALVGYIKAHPNLAPPTPRVTVLR